MDDVTCAVDDMRTMDVLMFLDSVSEGMKLGEGEQRFRVPIDGSLGDADDARLWELTRQMIDAGGRDSRHDDLVKNEG